MDNAVLSLHVFKIIKFWIHNVENTRLIVTSNKTLVQVLLLYTGRETWQDVSCPDKLLHKTLVFVKVDSLLCRPVIEVFGI